MLIGVPKEIKNHEYRVGMTPASVRELVHHGHMVMVQKGAGREIGLDDKMYVKAGAEIIDTPEEMNYFRHGGILPYVLRQLASR